MLLLQHMVIFGSTLQQQGVYMCLYVGLTVTCKSKVCDRHISYCKDLQAVHMRSEKPAYQHT